MRWQARCGLLLVLAAAHAASAEVMRFTGTIGQQAVTLTVDVTGDRIEQATYQYSSMKQPVTMVQHRIHGTTAVMADDDGNVFHLHLQRADGTGVKDFAAAERLAGTMDRDELDLPVELLRVPGSK